MSQPNEYAAAAYPGDPLAHLQWWCDTSTRAADELRQVLDERDRLRAELHRIRDMTGQVRHATAEECIGCGCRLLTAEDALLRAMR